MEQIQCPHCNYYKVVPDLPGGDPGCAYMASFGLGGLFLLMGLTTNDGGGTVVGLVLVGAGIFAVVYRSNHALTHHRCLNCGYKWETKEQP